MVRARRSGRRGSQVRILSPRPQSGLIFSAPHTEYRVRYKCAQCGTEKEADQFYAYPDGKRHSYCYSCSRERDRARDTLPHRRAKVDRIRNERREQIREIKTQACTDCHRSYPYFVMDMDHVGAKTKEMSRMLSSGRGRISAEASNCEPVCANCHRIRTFKRGYKKPGAPIVAIPRKSHFDKNWKPTGPVSGKSKICSTCHKTLPVEWFAVRNAKTGVLVSNCRPCSSEYQTRWHQAAGVERKDRQVATRKARKETAQTYVSTYKERHGCADCHKKWPAYVLDLDHIGVGKDGMVSAMVNRGDSLEKIIQEMAKCEVVCANCHRCRTQNRRLGKPIK